MGITKSLCRIPLLHGYEWDDIKWFRRHTWLFPIAVGTKEVWPRSPLDPSRIKLRIWLTWLHNRLARYATWTNNKWHTFKSAQIVAPRKSYVSSSCREVWLPIQRIPARDNIAAKAYVDSLTWDVQEKNWLATNRSKALVSIATPSCHDKRSVRLVVVGRVIEIPPRIGGNEHVVDPASWVDSIR